MARISVVFCDLHLEKGERVQAEELPPITIEGKGPRVLALCPEHKRDFYDPFVELVDDLGQDEAAGTAAEQVGQPVAQSEATAGAKSTEPQESSRDDPEQVVAESPAMTELPDESDTAQWECPVDGCDKTYTASGDTRAEDLKRLGNLHLSTSHGLDKSARRELLSA